MNDILAPVFAVFLAKKFKKSYVEMENNLAKIKDQIEENFLFPVEADSFHFFQMLLSDMKENYIKGFKGISESLKQIQELVKKADPQLFNHLF